MNAHKTYWETKKIKEDLKNQQNVSETTLTSLDNDIEGIVKAAINECAESLIEQAHDSLDSGRKNELRTSLKLSLNKLANRLDRGFNLEIRFNKPEVEFNEEDELVSEYSEEDVEIYDKIKNHCDNFNYIEACENPVLSLPESKEEIEKEEQENKSNSRKKAKKTTRKKIAKK